MSENTEKNKKKVDETKKDEVKTESKKSDSKSKSKSKSKAKSASKKKSTSSKKSNSNSKSKSKSKAETKSNTKKKSAQDKKSGAKSGKKSAEKKVEVKSEEEINRLISENIISKAEDPSSPTISLEEIESETISFADHSDENEEEKERYFEKINEHFEDEAPTTEVILPDTMKEKKFKFSLDTFKNPSFWINVLLFLLPFISASAIMLFIYKLKAIIPFGDINVAYSDFSQTVLPAYYHLHDVVFEGKNLFYDFFTGAGTNAYAFMTFSGIFSPVSWLTLLVPKDEILNFIPYFFMIKVGLMATTFSIFIRKIYPKISHWYSLILSLLYAISGYTFLYFIVFQFMDVLILFPILLLGLLKIYREDKFSLYAVTLALSTIMCYYLSFMIALFVLFSGVVAIPLFVSKDRKKKVITNLGLGTIFGFLLSAFVTIPTYIQVSKSIRLSHLDLKDILNSGFTCLSSKVLTVITLSVVIPIIIAFFYKLFTKRLSYYDKKYLFFFSSVSVLLILPIIFDSINRVWHMGSYVGFPYRYGFITIAFLLTFCGYYLSRFGYGREDVSEPLALEDRISPKKLGKRLLKGKVSDLKFINTEYGKKYYKIRNNKPLAIFIALLCLISSVIFVIRALNIVGNEGKLVSAYIPIIGGLPKEVFPITISIAVCFILAFFFLNRLSTTSVFVKPLLLVTVIVNILSFSVLLFGMQEYRLSTENSAKYVDDAVGISENVVLADGKLSRIKDKDLTLNSNYPTVMSRASLSGWYHFIPKSAQDSHKALGYSTVYTRTLDSGGTIFSDMILGVHDVISTGPESKYLYERSGDYNGANIYHTKYNVPLGIVYHSDNSDITMPIDGSLTPFDYQNKMYKTLLHSERDIINIYDVKPKANNVITENLGEKFIVRPNAYGNSEPSTLTYNLKVKDRQMLYLDLSDCYGGRLLVNVLVNDEYIAGNSVSSDDPQYFFPSTWDNGLIELGVFKNESVKVVLTFTNAYSEIHFRNIRIGGIKLNQLKAVAKKLNKSDCEYNLSKDSLHFKVTAKENRSLFIPFNYDDGFTCILNGEEADISRVYGNFMKIDLTSGENDINLYFKPTGFDKSLLISLVSLLILLFFAIFPKLNVIVYNRVVMSIAEIVFWIVGISLLLVIYIFFGFGSLFVDKLSPVIDDITGKISQFLGV